MNLRRYLRFHPFDTSTQAGRAAERYRLAAWTTLASVASKGSVMIVMVLSVSLTISYLGPQRFGVWMTVASFATMLSFLGLGVGNALTNHVACRASEGDPALLRRAISGGLGFLMMLGLVVGAGLFLLAAGLPWASLIKVEEAALLLEARDAAKVFAVLFGLNLLTTGIQSVFAGLQRAFESHLASALGTFVSLAALVLAAQAQSGIPTLLAVTMGLQLFAVLLLLILLAKRKLFSFRDIGLAVGQEASGLLRIGGLFFILQIGTMIGWGADAMIISSALGPVQVAVYSIVQRYFQFLTQPLAMVNMPLWSAYADAHAKGDLAFIRRTLRASMGLTLAVSLVGAVIFLACSHWLLSYWTGGSVEVPIQLTAAVALWAVFESCGVAFAMFLNGVQVVRQQVVVVAVFCAVVLPLKIFGINSAGLIAIPLSTALAYALTHVYFYGFVFYPRIKSILTNPR
ncbi:MAG: lipopolysaccharide biosynthesis protein [Rhodoferax sp.]